jgi:hypothetical protein
MIRSVAPGDLWALRRKPRSQVLLYNEALLAEPHRPLWFALRCLLQGGGRDRGMTVFHDRGLRAMVQSQGRYGRPEQDIIYLVTQGAPGRGLPSDHDIWFHLLERLCIYAGQNYVQRLFTAVPHQYAEIREIFRQLGFQAYANRTILQLSGPDWNQGTTLAPMRGQSRRDHWAIHKLYGSVTPHLVQHAEARNSRTWLLPLTQRWRKQYRRAWIMGPEDDLTTYVHILSGAAAHVITLLLQPDAREQMPDVLRFGLAQLHDNRPVYLLLREYQQDLLVFAQDLGFQPVAEQTLLMKSMVVPVRRSVLLPVLEPSLEPQVRAPGVSTSREDSFAHVRTTRSNS